MLAYNDVVISTFLVLVSGFVSGMTVSQLGNRALFNMYDEGGQGRKHFILQSVFVRSAC